jgi:hypothetical protein
MHTSGRELLAGIAVLIAGYGLGRLLVRRLLPHWDGWPAQLQACAIGLGCLSLIDLVFTGLGWFRPTPLSALVVCLAVASGATILFRSRPTLPRPAWSVSTGLVAALMAVLVVTAVGALAPETKYDALWYHLGFPSQWLHTGRLSFFPSQYSTAYPFANELLYGDAIALAGPIAAKAVNLGFGVLLIGATIDLGRRLFSLRVALIGALCLGVAPVVIWDAGTANADLSAAMFIVLAVDVAVARLDRPDRRSAVACGLLVGFAMATKLTTVYAAPLLALLLLAGPTLRAPARRIGDAVVVALMSVMPVLPYLIRSEVLTGNPVFPFFYGTFGAKASLWNATSDMNFKAAQDRYGTGHGVVKLLTLPWNLIAHPEPFGGSFGILLVVGLFLALKWRPRRIPAIVAAGAISSVALWFWPGGTLQSRYIIPAAALLAPFAGAGVERVVTLAGRVSRPLGLATVSVCTAAVIIAPLIGDTNYGSLADALQGRHYSIGGESQQSYLAQEIPTYGSEMRLKQLARPRDRVLAITDADIDQVDTPVEHIPYFALDVKGIYLSDGQAMKDLAQQHVQFIMWQRHSLATQGVVVARPEFERRYLRLVYADAKSVLYEVRERWQEALASRLPARGVKSATRCGRSAGVRARLVQAKCRASGVAQFQT